MRRCALWRNHCRNRRRCSSTIALLATLTALAVGRHRGLGRAPGRPAAWRPCWRSAARWRCSMHWASPPCWRWCRRARPRPHQMVGGAGADRRPGGAASPAPGRGDARRISGPSSRRTVSASGCSAPMVEGPYAGMARLLGLPPKRSPGAGARRPARPVEPIAARPALRSRHAAPATATSSAWRSRHCPTADGRLRSPIPPAAPRRRREARAVPRRSTGQGRFLAA